MRSIVNNELGYNELIIEECLNYQEDYQMRMLRECALDGLISVRGYGEDDKSQYIYDISSTQSIKQIYEKESMDETIIKEICKQLLEVMLRIKEHMLDVNKLLLGPEYILKSIDKIEFCYYPLNVGNINESFHTFTEYLVKAVDYDDVNAVRLVCGLHKSTMEEQYDIAEVLERYSEIEFESNTTIVGKSFRPVEDIWAQEVRVEENNIKVKGEDMGVKSEASDAAYYNLSWEQQAASILRETPLIKWWGSKKKPSIEKKAKVKSIGKEKWGDWETLINEELPSR